MSPTDSNHDHSLETGEGSRRRGEVGSDVTSPLERKRKANINYELTLDCFPTRRPKGYEQSFLDLLAFDFSSVAYRCRGTNDRNFVQGKQTKFQASGQAVATDRTSLDSIYKSRHGAEGEWSKKQKRAFHRLLSGIKAAMFRGRIVRFMTLTTGRDGDFSQLNRHCEHLVKRIRRGYFLPDDERKRRKKAHEEVRFEYCKVKTNEGNGVLHIVFWGEYIPQPWLSRTWEELHGAKIVDIRVLHGDTKRMAAYLATQYLSTQNASYIRMSYSHGWVCRGFVKRWRNLWDVLGEKRSVLTYWTHVLQSENLGIVYRQLQL